MSQKILLTAIFKDDSEIELAERMLTSFMPHVSGLAVAITGLSGKHQQLQKLIKKHGGQTVFTEPTKHPDIYSRDEQGKWYFSNFAAARNASFALADEMNKEGQYDWYTWADVDDILFGGEELQLAAKKAGELKLDSVFCTYWYSVQVDDKGNITNVAIEHLRERLVKPGVYKWTSRLHEVMVAKDEAYQQKAGPWDFNPQEGRKLVWAHVPPNERVTANLYRNNQILRTQMQEEQGKDPRTVFYIAKTDIDLAKLENKPTYLVEAEGLLKKYLEMSGWDEERANAYEYLGNIYASQNKLHEALKAYQAGLSEHPIHHLLYMRIADTYMKMQQWEKAEWWLNLILRADAPKARTTIGNPLEVQATAAGLKVNLCVAQNKIEEALTWYRKRNKLLGLPNDDEFTKNFEEAIEYNNAGQWIYNYSLYLKRKGKTDQLAKIMDIMTPEHKKEPFVQVIANQILPPKKWSDKSIVYYCGQTFEDWSDKSKSKGLGGSETAVIELSKEWAKQGYEVTVYTNVGDEEGTRDGVTYKHHSTLNWNDEFNIFIAWRNPAAIDMPIKAKKIFYDAHDIESNLNWTPERVAKLDKAFFKSKWHRSNVPNIPDEKAAVIHNGIYV